MRRIRRARGERGAALVEFALVLPIFLMLLLAMFTGGMAWNVKLSLTQGVREAARTGATLPRGADVNAWLAQVADVTVRAGDGELGIGASGRSICVAYVSGADTVRRVEDANGAAVIEPGATCYADGLDSTGQPRVQVVATRTRTLEALLFAQRLDLRGRAVARLEATGP